MPLPPKGWLDERFGFHEKSKAVTMCRFADITARKLVLRKLEPWEPISDSAMDFRCREGRDAHPPPHPQDKSDVSIPAGAPMQPTELPGVVFQPWVGPDYGRSPPRILVLGESHYGGNDVPDAAGFTRWVVATFGLARRDAFMTKIAKLLLLRPPGDALGVAERTSFWNSVVFYNYVQRFVGAGPRVPPTQDDWAAGVKPAALQGIRLRALYLQSAFCGGVSSREMTAAVYAQDVYPEMPENISDVYRRTDKERRET